MRVKAAVLYGPRTKYQIEDIELDPPQENEVLVKFAATGLCHSDEHLVTGDMVADPSHGSTWKQFPMIAGHEGAGVIEEVGPRVTSVRPGDHVVTSFVPSCGVCPSCSSGHQNLCDLGATLTAGRQADGTSRHHTSEGQDCATMCALGTFAEYSVVNTASVIKIPDHLPLDIATEPYSAPTGCRCRSPEPLREINFRRAKEYSVISRLDIQYPPVLNLGEERRSRWLSLV